MTKSNHSIYADYEQVEIIEYQGLHYPNRCTQCKSEIQDGATVFPPAKAIFCDDDCAALWFAGCCETITSIKDEEGTPCIPS